MCATVPAPGTYNILDPRVAVRPAPYALYALGGSPGPVGPAGPAGPPGPPGDSHWQINGSATYYNDGFVGIGESDPLANLHLRTGDLMLDGSSLFGEDAVLEGSDAILGMYSSGGGGFGSGVVLGEMSAGALVNKWAMVKRTSQAGDRLFFTFGTDPNYGLNPVRVAFHPEGYVAMGTDPLFFDTESTLTINTGTDQHGVLVYANAQGGSAIGLHAGPVGFSGVPKNAWFDGGMGGWNRYDVAMGSSKIETEPSGRMTLATAEANANPIQFENAMYLGVRACEPARGLVPAFQRRAWTAGYLHSVQRR